MTDPYIGEIRLSSFAFAPADWAFCDGRLLPISTHRALYAVLQTQYGGDGVTNFALPNLQARMPIAAGNVPAVGYYAVGNSGGESTHVLTAAEMPAHRHVPRARTEASSPGGTSPANGQWAATGKTVFAANPGATMSELAVDPAGGGSAHENMPPYLVLNFIIALVGTHPSPN